MLALAALLIVGWAVTVALFLRSQDRSRREHARREDLLVNQLCNALGRPWQPAPSLADDDGLNQRSEPVADWVTDPEQLIGA